MTEPPADAVAPPDAGTAMTDLEQQVAGNEPAGRGKSGTDTVQVTERHGIWTVTAGGEFVGDYHDPEAATAAAEQARHRGQVGGEDSDVADPWQRSEQETRR